MASDIVTYLTSLAGNLKEHQIIEAAEKSWTIDLKVLKEMHVRTAGTKRTSSGVHHQRVLMTLLGLFRPLFLLSLQGTNIQAFNIFSPVSSPGFHHSLSHQSSPLFGGVGMDDLSTRILSATPLPTLLNSVDDNELADAFTDQVDVLNDPQIQTLVLVFVSIAAILAIASFFVSKMDSAIEDTLQEFETTLRQKFPNRWKDLTGRFPILETNDGEDARYQVLFDIMEDYQQNNPKLMAEINSEIVKEGGLSATKMAGTEDKS